MCLACAGKTVQVGEKYTNMTNMININGNIDSNMKYYEIECERLSILSQPERLKPYIHKKTSHQLSHQLNKSNIHFFSNGLIY